MASVTFSTSLGGTGQTITDGADPNTGLANGGHRERFVPALSGAVDMAATSVAKAQEAEDLKNLCQQLRNEAETFKNQASDSESSAATSATLSEDWATKLSTSVDGVEYSSKYYANEASVSASSASDSADAASVSEGNAAISESNALASADNASASASDAATSESLAEDWATKTDGTVDGVEYSAKYYSEQASSDAMTAGGFAGDAETSANNAAASESNAENSESAAALSASNASDSEILASEYAQEAQGHSEDAEAWAASVNIPSAEGQAGRIIRQADDESGFEYVDPPYTQSEADLRYVQSSDRDLSFEYSGDGGLVVRTLNNEGSFIFQARSSEEVPRFTVKHGAPELVGDASGWNFSAMPTVGGDPIVEWGSNANGEYVKYADGTQHCTSKISLNAEIIQATTSSVPYPSSFSHEPFYIGVTLSHSNTDWTDGHNRTRISDVGYAGSVGLNACTFRVAFTSDATFSEGATIDNCFVFITGRWF